ncbi:hypothetical protein CKA32_003824 [Geitlerinema sp. FC II]|nr:hypothetical protein CKA32_003824 [Geitlerinema sp. FC II]
MYWSHDLHLIFQVTHPTPVPVTVEPEVAFLPSASKPCVRLSPHTAPE